jgi:hypothetical protein
LLNLAASANMGPWLVGVKQGLEEEARLVLQHTVDDEDVETVLNGIKESMEESKGTSDATMLEIMFCPRPLARKGIWLALMLAFFQQVVQPHHIIAFSLTRPQTNYTSSLPLTLTHHLHRRLRARSYWSITCRG